MDLCLNGMHSNNSLMDYELNCVFSGVLIGISMGKKSLLLTHYHSNIPFILATSFLVFTTTVSDARANNKSSSLTYAVNVHLKTCKKVTKSSVFSALFFLRQKPLLFFPFAFLLPRIHTHCPGGGALPKRG